METSVSAMESKHEKWNIMLVRYQGIVLVHLETIATHALRLERVLPEIVAPS